MTITQQQIIALAVEAGFPVDDARFSSKLRKLAKLAYDLGASKAIEEKAKRLEVGLLASGYDAAIRARSDK